MAPSNLPATNMKRTKTVRRCPRVAVCVDKTGGYGRGLLRGIAEYVEACGPWSLCLDHHASGHYASDWLRHWNGDGVLAYVDTQALAGQLCRSRIPAVEVFGTRLDLNLPQVANDEPAFGCLAAEHFLLRGFRHFAFSGYRGKLWSDRRSSGFQSSLAEAGFQAKLFSCPQKTGSLARWEQTQQALTRWLEKLPKPLGLMACSDRHALRILDACRRARIAVPEEIAVIGVDNDEETCRLADPPLTSVMDDAPRIGFEAARLLGELMSGRRRKREWNPILIPPAGVVTRRSTETTAIDDSLVASAARLIRERACGGLTVPALLQELRISRSAFYDRFHAELGRSPHQEILRVKLERAKSLLAQTDLSLQEIAGRAGFDHPEYLQVAFKREVGVTPGKFRRAGHG